MLNKVKKINKATDINKQNSACTHLATVEENHLISRSKWKISIGIRWRGKEVQENGIFVEKIDWEVEQRKRFNENKSVRTTKLQAKLRKKCQSVFFTAKYHWIINIFSK